MRKDIQVEFGMPAEVQAVHYARNSHYIKLTDCKKRTTKLFAKKTMRFKCSGCGWSMIAENMDEQLPCPKCSNPLDAQWGKLQLCFLPDDESEFDA